MRAADGRETARARGPGHRAPAREICRGSNPRICAASTLRRDEPVPTSHTNVVTAPAVSASCKRASLSARAASCCRRSANRAARTYAQSATARMPARAANVHAALDVPAHSITSSARASTVAGISRPSAFAVLRLITSSYLVGACTGRSAGFSPLRMRST
jgi:hypothetical protein